MRTGVVLPLRALLGLTLAIGWLSVLAPGDDGPQRWVTTWTTANAASDHPTVFSNQTIREIVHTTIGGGSVRIRLSNTFGTRAIRLDAVFIGLQKMEPREAGLQRDGAALAPRSNHEVTFGGSRSIAIPEGAEALSDPISFSVGSEQNLAISLFTAGETGPATAHGSAFQTNYVSGAGNFAAEEGANAFAVATEIGAGPRIEGAHLPLERDRGEAPIEPCLVTADLFAQLCRFGGESHSFIVQRDDAC